MGACLVTAYWTPCENDRIFITNLQNLAINRGVSINVDPNLSSYRPGFASFSAEISGFSIPWRGGVEACSDVLGRLGEEWKASLLRGGGQNVSIVIEYLPM